DVDDDVAVVQQHPAGVALALAAQRLAAALGEQRLLDAVDDRGDLPLGLPAAHEEHVGDDDQLGDVQADHLVGELVGGGLSGHPGEVEGFFRGAHAAASSRTGWTRGVPDGTGRAASAADASPGPMTPVSSSTTSTTRAIAMSAHTSHTRARPPLFSGRCSTLPSNRGAGRGSGASVAESSPSATPSASGGVVAAEPSSAPGTDADADADGSACGAGCSLSSMIRALLPNLRRVGTGASAEGGATAPRTPGTVLCSPLASIAARASRAALSSALSARARRPRRGVVSGSVIGRHLLCRGRTC